MELPHLVPRHSTHMGLEMAPRVARLTPELWGEQVEVEVGVEVLRVEVGTTGEQLGWLGRAMMALFMASSSELVTP